SWPDAEMTAWLAEADPDPAGPADRRELVLGVPFDAPDGPALRGAALMSITLDGRYLFIADAAGGQVRAVDLATFTEVLAADVRPVDGDGDPRLEGPPVALA